MALASCVPRHITNIDVTYLTQEDSITEAEKIVMVVSALFST